MLLKDEDHEIRSAISDARHMTTSAAMVASRSDRLEFIAGSRRNLCKIIARVSAYSAALGMEIASQYDVKSSDDFHVIVPSLRPWQPDPPTVEQLYRACRSTLRDSGYKDRNQMLADFMALDKRIRETGSLPGSWALALAITPVQVDKATLKMVLDYMLGNVSLSGAPEVAKAALQLQAAITGAT